MLCTIQCTWSCVLVILSHILFIFSPWRYSWDIAEGIVNIRYLHKKPGPLFLEFNSKMELGDLNFKTILKIGGFRVSIIISCVLKILASQDRFQSLYDVIFNIDRFLEYYSLSLCIKSKVDFYVHLLCTKYNVMLVWVSFPVLGSRYLFFHRLSAPAPYKKVLSAPAPYNFFYRLLLQLPLKSPSSGSLWFFYRLWLPLNVPALGFPVSAPKHWCPFISHNLSQHTMK